MCHGLSTEQNDQSRKGARQRWLPVNRPLKLCGLVKPQGYKGYQVNTASVLQQHLCSHTPAVVTDHDETSCHLWWFHRPLRFPPHNIAACARTELTKLRCLCRMHCSRNCQAICWSGEAGFQGDSGCQANTAQSCCNFCPLIPSHKSHRLQQDQLLSGTGPQIPAIHSSSC